MKLFVLLSMLTLTITAFSLDLSNTSEKDALINYLEHQYGKHTTCSVSDTGITMITQKYIVQTSNTEIQYVFNKDSLKVETLPHHRKNLEILLNEYFFTKKLTIDDKTFLSVTRYDGSFEYLLEYNCIYEEDGITYYCKENEIFYLKDSELHYQELTFRLL